MVLIDNDNLHDPRVNLALEEYCLRNLDFSSDYLLFYVNDPSIVIGRNQNPFEEVNTAFARDKGIRVVRRISGGGAVYHDRGNLNFSFLAGYRKGNLLNFEKFTLPVIRALDMLGVQATLNERNDIVAGGRKISGTAQFSTKSAMVTHGTLLFDADVARLNEALAPEVQQIASCGRKSVRSQVVNISELTGKTVTMSDFRMALTEAVCRKEDGNAVCALDGGDWRKVRKLAAEKYGAWEWTYGKAPKFTVSRMYSVPCGTIDTRIRVERGIMVSVDLLAEFSVPSEVSGIERALEGQRYDPAIVRQYIDFLQTSRACGTHSRQRRAGPAC